MRPPWPISDAACCSAVSRAESSSFTAMRIAWNVFVEGLAVSDAREIATFELAQESDELSDWKAYLAAGVSVALFVAFYWWAFMTK